MTSDQTIQLQPQGAFASVGDPESDAHVNGEYLRKNPSWHVEHSSWKAGNVLRMLHKHNLNPGSVCDVGCGVGEVLRQLQLNMNPECRLWGYDVAPDAIRPAKTRENERMKFELADLTAIETPRFDLLVMTEVVDHVEDCFRFLRALRQRAEWKIFSFSLDFSTESSLRPGVLLRWREFISHIHQFNQPIVMDLLRRTGYEVVDYYYAPWHCGPSNFAARVKKGLSALVFKINPDLAARLFIGYNLIVLAR
jgi:SAM-dependent methyltransferase